MSAEGAGQLEGEGVRAGRAEHPACGDVLEVTCRFEADTLVGFAWRADGCPATVGVAAAAHGALLGVDVADAPERLRARLAELGGLAAHERHAERMLLRALTTAHEAGE